MNRIHVFFALVVWLSVNMWACEAPTKSHENKNAEKTTPQDSVEGLALLQNNCFSCHSPNATHESRIAPPMIAIKEHYWQEGKSKAEFVAEIKKFLHEPSEANSKMPNAVKKFGVMPKMSFSDEQIEKIAAYIYEHDLEKPDWFKQAHQAQKSQHLDYMTLGQQYAMNTKAILGKNLLGAINQKGVENAVSFCNTRAYPLTDSMARALGASIRRVSDKPRNAQNKASETELAYIENAKKQLEKGEKIKPQLLELTGKMVGYYPIETNKMCLQCHGNIQKDLKPTTLQQLKKLYPNDKAVDYTENQLRGIWVVEMNKK